MSSEQSYKEVFAAKLDDYLHKPGSTKPSEKLSPTEFAKKIIEKMEPDLERGDVYETALKSMINKISKWRNGKSLPNIDTLFAIADIMDCDLDYLFGRREYKYFGNDKIIETLGLRETDINILRKIQSARTFFYNYSGDENQSPPCGVFEYFEYEKDMWSLHCLISNLGGCLTAIKNYIYSSKMPETIVIKDPCWITVFKQNGEDPVFDDPNASKVFIESRYEYNENDGIYRDPIGQININGADITDELIKTAFLADVKNSLDRLSGLDFPDWTTGMTLAQKEVFEKRAEGKLQSFYYGTS